MAVVVIAALAIGTFSQPRLSDTEREFRLSETIRCPTCSGQSAATSDSPSSAAIRTIIRDRVQDGQTDEEITDFVVGQFPGTRLDPSGSGFSALVWALPVGLVVIALAALWFRFRDWRPGTLAVSDADRTLVADALAAKPAPEPPVGFAVGGASPEAQVAPGASVDGSVRAGGTTVAGEASP